jgi:hypothetical protein
VLMTRIQSILDKRVKKGIKGFIVDHITIIFGIRV